MGEEYFDKIKETRPNKTKWIDGVTPFELYYCPELRSLGKGNFAYTKPYTRTGEKLGLTLTKRKKKKHIKEYNAMLFETLYKTRTWLKYIWCEITNWLDYIPDYCEEDEELRKMRHSISSLISYLDLHFFNVYGQEEGHERRKELVKKLILKQKNG